MRRNGSRVIAFVCVLAAVSLFVVLVGATTEDAEAATLVVPTDYKTIQDAVDAAGRRDDILIKPGSYTESVVVKKAIVIKGSGSNTRITAAGAYGFDLQVDRVAIFDLTIRSATVAGINVEGDNCRISGVTVIQNKVGILLNDVSNAIIIDTDCRRNSDQGLMAVSCDLCTFDNVTFVENTDGVRFTGGMGNTFTGCTALDNVDYGYFMVALGAELMVNLTISDSRSQGNDEYGVYVSSSEGLLLHNLNVTENEATGILCRGIKDARIRRCNVTLNLYVGIAIAGTTTNEGVIIENCLLQKQYQVGGTSGLYLHRMSGVTVANCTIMGYIKGVSVYSSSEVLIVNNSITGYSKTSSPYETGIYVGHIGTVYEAPTNITIVDNTIDRVAYGFTVVEAWGLLIEGCDVTYLHSGFFIDTRELGAGPIRDLSIRNSTFDSEQPLSYGVMTVYCYNVLVDNCSLTNGQVSVQSSGGDIRVTNNTIEYDLYTNREAIILSTNTYTLVENNTITGLFAYGIRVTYGGSSMLNIIGNTIERTGTDVYPGMSGISLASANSGIVESNLIAGGRYGITIDNGAAYGNTIRYNTIRDCTTFGLFFRTQSGYNYIYLNNLVSNAEHANEPQTDSLFDNGTLGNYWDDYRTKYPDATVVGRVWDTPYAVAGSTVFDNYPLAFHYDTVPPVADAGDDVRVLAGTLVDLIGSDSSDDWRIINFTWNFTYGGEEVLLYGKEPQFRYHHIGTHVVTLTVSDGWGNTGLDTMTVEVYDDRDPVADAGEEVHVDMGVEFGLDGSGSSDNGVLVSWVWTIDPLGQAWTHEGRTVLVTLEEPGSYQVELNVTDEAGNWDIDTTVVHVRDTEAPVADAGEDIVVNMGEEAQFDGSGSTDNVGVEKWVWTIDLPGTPPSVEGETATYTFLAPGEFSVALVVWDNSGNSDSDTLTVTVVDNVPPVADAGDDQEVEPGSTVSLDGSGSTDNIGVVSWVWTFDDIDPVRLEGAEVEYTFPRVGAYTITLTVADEAGNEGTDQVLVMVGDASPPEADAGEDQEVDQGTEVTLDGSGSSDNVGITDWSWSFEEEGETVTLEGETVTHTFALAGVYLVTLSVADEAGNEDTDTMTVTVLDTEAPLADAGEDLIIDLGDEAVFDGTGSSDNVGIESLVWTFTYKGSEEHLEGLTARFTFEEEGTYQVTLTVTDAAGNEGTDTMSVRVLGEDVPWQLGPFADKGGKAVEGVRVVVTLNGTKYTEYTDEEGNAELTLPRDDLVSPVKVTATKEGWKDLDFEMPLDDAGGPSEVVPTMERVEEGSSYTILVVLIVVVGVIAVFAYLATKGGKR